MRLYMLFQKLCWVQITAEEKFRILIEKESLDYHQNQKTALRFHVSYKHNASQRDPDPGFPRGHKVTATG